MQMQSCGCRRAMLNGNMSQKHSSLVGHHGLAVIQARWASGVLTPAILVPPARCGCGRRARHGLQRMPALRPMADALSRRHATGVRARARAAQVVRTALLDASSVSSLMMTSEAIICDAPEPAKAMGPPGGGMGGMGGMGDMY